MGIQAGDVVGERFKIEQLAGSGRTGYVYRAHDRHLDVPVALKVLHSNTAQQASRFAREVRALMTLQLPGVTRYIAHGVAPTGQLYLAMQWLSGETLSQRLARQ